jgi:hypothetical protein
MTRKISFALIFAFWLCMNYWLWRAEYGGGQEAGSSIPVRPVWEKMLKAPDNSALEITHRGRKLGYLRWMPNIGEELATGKTGSEEAPPEGMIKNMSGYTVDIEGNVVLAAITNHVRGNMHIEFGKDFQWLNVHVMAQLKSGSLEIHTSAADRTVQLNLTAPGFDVRRQFTYAELQNPAGLLESFELPPALLPLAGQPQAGPSQNSGPVWTAFNDNIRYGRNTVRVYRLKAKLWDRYEASVLVSRVGEILRVDLPNHLTLKNDMLFAN